MESRQKNFKFIDVQLQFMNTFVLMNLKLNLLRIKHQLSF